jgi:hypothetical protein
MGWDFCVPTGKVPHEAKGEEMSKEKRSAEEQVADEADRRALHPLASRQISDSQAAPEFQQKPPAPQGRPVGA